MKKALFICFTLIGVALLSCKKDHTKTNPTGKLYPVSFNLSGFTQTINAANQNNKTKVNTVDPSASNVVKLIYKLYDSNNTLQKTLVFKKGAPSFGTITDNLAAGTYSAVFLGLTDSTNYVDNITQFYYRNVNGFSETFYNKTNFTVGAAPVQQGVVLKRLNSEILVVIKDAIPSGVANITATVTGAHNTCAYLTAQSSLTLSYPIGGTASVVITSANVGTTNLPLGPITNLFNNTSTVTVTIVARAPNGTNIAQKTISNVALQPSIRTILTGNVFSNDGSTGGFAVTFDPNFSGNINQGF